MSEERPGESERGLTRREVVVRGGAAAGALTMGGWLLAACGGDDDETGAAATGATQEGGGEVDVVNWALTGDAPAIDYVKAYDFNTNGVMTSITEPLLLMNPQGELQPNLAEEWELTDPTTMVIKLRSGVKFHDGSDMTAEDVAFSLNRHRDPDVGSYLATFHDRVKNVEASGPLDVTVTFTPAGRSLPVRPRDDGRGGCFEGLHRGEREQGRNAGRRHRRHRPLHVHLVDEGPGDRHRPLRRLLEHGPRAARSSSSSRRSSSTRQRSCRPCRPARSTASGATTSRGRAPRRPSPSTRSTSFAGPPTGSTTWP